MPRTARLDAPGILHHVMIRGIERREIFRNNTDRENFIDRLEILCPATQTTVTLGLLCLIMPTFFSAQELATLSKMGVGTFFNNLIATEG